MGFGGGNSGNGGKSGTDFDTGASTPVSPTLIEQEREEDKQEPQSDASGGDAERVKALEARVLELESALAEARAAAMAAARRAEIERALTAAGAIDLEITTPLVEQVVAGMDEPDIGKAVREVRAGKSFLFRTSTSGGVRSESMAGRPSGAGPGLDDLASEARASGDRADLLRYLRARRG